MKTLYLAVIAVIVIAGSVGTSYALVTHNEAVNIFGDLNVIGGSINSQRTDGNDLANGLANSGGANVFQFFDIDDNQVYRLKLTGDGSEFIFQDFTHANRQDLVIKTDTGFIGIGETTPQEKLDVGGNLHVRDGTITADGDICIGNCP